MSSLRALERLYDAHASAVFGFLNNLCRSEADTRDVLQQVFVKLAREPASLANIRDERAFLLRLAHNLAIDFFRRHEARSRYHQAYGKSSAVFARTDDPDRTAFRERLTAALRDLPREQRAVVHLKLWEGLTFEQIAETLDISLNTAASRYRYGLDKLRTQLRPLYGEIEHGDKT